MSCALMSSFFFSRRGDHRDLHSFPTRRSSDLWAATLLSVWVQAYNTKLLKKEELPGTYRDLLDPRWKGKLGIEAKDQDRSEEHTSELQSQSNLVCRLLLEKKNKTQQPAAHHAR